VTGPFTVQSALTELPDSIARGDCYQSIAGIGDYFFEYKILPRSADDLVGDGTNCLPEEEGETACMDTEDNDHDGYADCADISCQDTVPACVEDTDIVSIQDGTIATGTAVNLTDVYVLAVDQYDEQLWVTDSLAAAEYNGVYVYRGSMPDDVAANVTAGAIVDVSGRVSEQDGLTELKEPTITFKSGSGGAFTPLTGVGYATLADETDGEPYEGTLVTIEDVEVVATDLGHGKFSVGDATTPLIVDDDIYGYDLPTAGDCYASVTGIMHYNIYDGHRSLLPRSAADLQTGGTCN
jgi:hypothetical protein